MPFVVKCDGSVHVSRLQVLLLFYAFILHVQLSIIPSASITGLVSLSSTALNAYRNVQDGMECFSQHPARSPALLTVP